MLHNKILKDYLNIPNKYIIDSYISKEKILLYGNLKGDNKKNLKDLVRKIQWSYRFRAEEIKIPPYFTDKRRYGEVEIINIILKDENISKSPKENQFLNQDKKIDKLINIIFRIITFPQLLIVQYKSYVKLFATHISVNLVDSSKRTIDDIISTNWIDTKNLNDIEYTLFNNINFDNLNRENIYEFYNSYIKEIIRYNGSLTIGTEVNLETDRVKEINDEIEILNKEIKQLKSKLKKESQERLKRGYNNEIRIRRLQIRDLKKELEG